MVQCMYEVVQMRDNRLEETIELIKKDIKRIQNIQNEEISYNVKKSL